MTDPDQTAEGLDPKEKCNNKIAKILMDRLMDEHETCEKTCESLLDVYDIWGISSSFIIDIRAPSWMYSQTPLMAAASRNRLNCCKRLIQMGADLHVTDLQGYTALHYAALNGAQKCAKFLVDLGADPNAKSESGRNCYDLGIYNYLRSFLKTTRNAIAESLLFTYGATPKQQTEIFEMAGTLVVKTLEWNEVFELWDKAMEVCRKFDLQPSNQLLANLQFLRENRQNTGHLFEDFNRLAMNTVARLSEGNLKFWYLLNLVPSPHISSMLRLHPSTVVLEIFNFMSQELNRVADFGSLEEVDYKKLYDLVEYLDIQLLKLEQIQRPNIVDHLYCIVQLIISCFNKRIGITNSNNVSQICMDLYVKLVLVLTSTQYFGFTLKLDENLGLLRTLIELDLRDRDCNSLMHVFLQDDRFNFHSYVIDTLLDYDFVDVVTRNKHNQEPVQLIKWNSKVREKGMVLSILTKMAQSGAHFDAKIASGGPTLREIFQKKTPYLAFRYDNLQCACARVLVEGNVPYTNRVPKCIEEFIQVHM